MGHVGADEETARHGSRLLLVQFAWKPMRVSTSVKKLPPAPVRSRADLLVIEEAATQVAVGCSVAIRAERPHRRIPDVQLATGDEILVCAPQAARLHVIDIQFQLSSPLPPLAHQPTACASVHPLLALASRPRISGSSVCLLAQALFIHFPVHVNRQVG